jgi:hypothetical protein
MPRLVTTSGFLHLLCARRVYSIDPGTGSLWVAADVWAWRQDRDNLDKIMERGKLKEMLQAHEMLWGLRAAGPGRATRPERGVSFPRVLHISSCPTVPRIARLKNIHERGTAICGLTADSVLPTERQDSWWGRATGTGFWTKLKKQVKEDVAGMEQMEAELG